MKPVLWLLGLSGSGKTTLGSLLRLHLESSGYDTEFIDGDIFRRQFGFTGFRPEDRLRNITAMREYAMQLNAQDKICIVAAITPYDIMRRKNREQLPFYREVWVRCGLPTLKERDTKGLYQRAMLGQIDMLTGVSDTFDEPQAHCVIDTDHQTLGECYLKLRNFALYAIEERRDMAKQASHSQPYPLPVSYAAPYGAVYA